MSAAYLLLGLGFGLALGMVVDTWRESSKTFDQISRHDEPASGGDA